MGTGSHTPAGGKLSPSAVCELETGRLGRVQRECGARGAGSPRCEPQKMAGGSSSSNGAGKRGKSPPSSTPFRPSAVA